MCCSMFFYFLFFIYYIVPRWEIQAAFLEDYVSPQCRPLTFCMASLLREETPSTQRKPLDERPKGLELHPDNSVQAGIDAVQCDRSAQRSPTSAAVRPMAFCALGHCVLQSGYSSAGSLSPSDHALYQHFLLH